jgi:hypothetical protein
MPHAGRAVDRLSIAIAVAFAFTCVVGCGAGGEGSAGGAGGAGGDTPVATPSRQGPPANVVGGFEAEMPQMTLGPGEEAYPCMIVPLDLSGPSHVVGGGYVETGQGMHHGNITGRKSTGQGVRPCPADQGALGGEADDILSGGSVLFGSTTQFVGTEWRTFPDGMGFPIEDDYEIVLRMHYLNPTQQEITIAPKYEWFTIDESKLTHLLGPFLWAYSNFEIPPHAELTVTADCPITGPMNIVSMMPHMHKLGTRFYSAFFGGPKDGEVFLDTPGYNPDGLIEGFEPALTLDDGAGFTFSCSWNNTFDKEIVEGYGDNEMCMLFGYAYPYEDAFSALSTPGGACLTVGLNPR